MFYDTHNEKVGKWQSKISSRENLTDQGNLSRDIDNKTVRKEGISICLRTYNLLSKTQFICKQNGSSWNKEKLPLKWNVCVKYFLSFYQKKPVTRENWDKLSVYFTIFEW